MNQTKVIGSALLLALLAGCGGESSDSPLALPANNDGLDLAGDALDEALSERISDLGLTGAPESGRVLPDIEDPLPQLGMRLFFSKSLGGDFDSVGRRTRTAGVASGGVASLYRCL